MKKVLLISSFLCTMILSSCGFLLSPVGEELVVDGAQEIMKIEKEIVDSTKAPVVEKPKESEKEPVKEVTKEVK